LAANTDIPGRRAAQRRMRHGTARRLASLAAMIIIRQSAQTPHVPSCPAHKEEEGVRVKTLLTLVAIFAAFYVLNRFILPRLGIRG